MATGIGTVIFNFGSAPGTNVVQTVVSDTGISATSKVEIFMMGTDSTATHTAYEHSILPMSIALSCVSVVAATGFTAQCATNLRLTGTFMCRFIWAD